MPLFLLETIQRDAAISFPLLGDWQIDPPASFTVFGFTIYFYGVLIALGFLLAILFCTRHAPRFGIRPDDFYEMMLWLIPLVIVGARLYYVLFRLDYYSVHPAEIIAVRDGGLAIYGGVIAGFLVIVFFCRAKGLSMPAMLDLTVIGLLIGQIIGRWGNFMNREAFGAQTEIFCRMGLTDPSGHTIYVHPTFLYESLWNLVGFLFLARWAKKGKRKYDGQAALLYFFWYGLGRAWIEGLRTDSLYIGHTGIRVSQALSIVLVLFTGAMLLIQRGKEHPPEKLWVNRAAAVQEEAKKESEASENEASEKSE